VGDFGRLGVFLLKIGNINAPVQTVFHLRVARVQMVTQLDTCHLQVQGVRSQAHMVNERCAPRLCTYLASASMPEGKRCSSACSLPCLSRPGWLQQSAKGLEVADRDDSLRWSCLCVNVRDGCIACLVARTCSTPVCTATREVHVTNWVALCTRYSHST
jgi:hypothetical protein